MLKLKVNDNVKVMSGKDKGREGKIEKIFPKTKKAVVPGINVYKKHVKGYGKQKGGIYELFRPIDVSRLTLVCPKCKKPTRIGFTFVEKEKVRICKKCLKEIDSK